VKKNAIILTPGLTGSSVFAALFGLAGYWLGNHTVQNTDYDTFENAELVALNRELLGALAPGFNHKRRFSIEDIVGIERASQTGELQPCREFLARCMSHSPWLWKDPRLTWTIRVWAKVMDLRQTAFLVLTRDDLQAWISANNRRRIQSMRYTREYNDGITTANIRFLEESRLPFMKASFEDLLLQPEQMLDRLNDFFGLELSMSALRSVCGERLYHRSRGFKDLVMAALIYARNYHGRDGRGLGT
jgi:hypothetical protein